MHHPNWNYICDYLADACDEFRDVSSSMFNSDWQFLKMLGTLWNIAFFKTKE